MPTLVDMVPQILEKTEQSKLDWEQLTTASFVARLGSMSLEVSRRGDGNTFLSLRREDGNVLESVNYEELPGGIDRDLLALYEAARRRALGVDSILNLLKNTLDKL